LIFLGGDDLEADTINIASGQSLAADTMTGQSAMRAPSRP